MFLSVSHKPDTKDSKYNLLTVSIKQDVSCNLIIRWPQSKQIYADDANDHNVVDEYEIIAKSWWL